MFDMTRRRKRYDKRFKVSAAEVVLSGEMTVKSLSEELGIKDSTLRRWAAEYDKMAEAAFPGNGSPKADKDRGIVRLKKKVEEPGRENEMLKNFRAFSNQDRARGFGSSKGIGGGLGPVKKACALLKASKSGFYEYLGRKKPDARIEREALEGLAVDAFRRHKGRCGCRRIDQELRRGGIVASGKRVPHIMRKPGIVAEGAARRHGTAKKAEPGDPRLDLVERVFSVGERNRLRVGGMTCMPALEGRLCLAAVIDAFSRKEVGRPMPDRIAGKVAVDAIEQAAGREDPPDDGSLVFHGGQGARYASKAFRRCSDSHGAAQSASRPGTPSGSAAAESFFKTLRRELVKERRYEARKEAKQDIFKHVEPCCNRVRMHSYPGYMPPDEYGRKCA